jgi:hypothetical protein
VTPDPAGPTPKIVNAARARRLSAWNSNNTDAWNRNDTGNRKDASNSTDNSRDTSLVVGPDSAGPIQKIVKTARDSWDSNNTDAWNRNDTGNRKDASNSTDNRVWQDAHS